jgi:hypothetical protein
MHGGVIGVHPSICGVWLLYLCDFRFAEFLFIKQFIAIHQSYSKTMSTLLLPMTTSGATASGATASGATESESLTNELIIDQTYIDIICNYSQRVIRRWFYKYRMVKRIQRNVYNRKRYGCKVKTFIVEGSAHIVWVNPIWLNNGKTTLRIHHKSYSYKCTVPPQGEIIRNCMISTYDDNFYFNIKYV